jgi:hypothetical protein
MSTYDIRKIFTASAETRAINYIRNYNFNSSTVTDIPIQLTNGGDEVPITVNITTTEPWMEVVEPGTGVNLKYPLGNVVLPPTSSKDIILKINLPESIEQIPESVLHPELIFDLKTGSFAVVPPGSTQVTSSTGNSIVVSTTNVNIRPLQILPIEYTLYNSDEQVLTVSETALSVTSSKPSIVRVLPPPDATNSYSPLRLFGVLPGSATVTIKYEDIAVNISVTVRLFGAPPPDDTNE